jgi:glycosyltransferase involved in cell wall biosynthesis
MVAQARHVLIRKVLIRHADTIVANGSSGRRYLAGLGADPSRVHVVHQASALDARPRTPRPGGPLRLLFVGRLVSLKGLHLLLPALARYPAGSWSLTVAGDGPEREQLQAFVSRQGLPVEFAGFVPRARLPELFSDHDLLVFPTLKDEWGLVVGEALRAGLPVLGSLYSEAVCEMVVDGVTGWMMRPDRPDSIRAALNRLFAASDAELLRAGELAHQSVRQLSPEAMADQFLDVLRTARNTDPAVPLRAR